MKFEKIVNFKMPFDKRSIDPKKNYGIGSMRIWFILKKGQKATQIMISTNCYLSSVIKEYTADRRDLFFNDKTFDCWDVGYHSNTPQYKGQTIGNCDILKSGKCYYDGSGLRGTNDKVAENFLKHGEKWIWEYLTKEWNARFSK